MGRYDFAPLRVRQTAKALVDSKRNAALPPWYGIVGDIPPGETLARPVMQAPRVHGKSKRASKLFQPLRITYPEDKLRQEFFGDHPWELARPRVVVEDTGNDAKQYDWSSIVQPGKQLDGERCLSLLQNSMHGGGLTAVVSYNASYGS
jgi:small subunit ribosomal protein S23